MKNILLTVVALAALAFTSCKKEDKVNPPNTVGGNSITREQLLDKKWKLTAKTVDPARSYSVFGPKVTDWFAQMDGCQTDNTKTYKGDGAMLFDEGAVKCKTDDAQTKSGSWLFNSDNSTITETLADKSSSLMVISIGSTTFKATYVEDYFGTKYTFSETYMAQ